MLQNDRINQTDTTDMGPTPVFRQNRQESATGEPLGSGGVYPAVSDGIGLTGEP